MEAPQHLLLLFRVGLPPPVVLLLPPVQLPVVVVVEAQLLRLLSLAGATNSVEDATVDSGEEGYVHQLCLPLPELTYVTLSRDVSAVMTMMRILNIAGVDTSVARATTVVSTTMGIATVDTMMTTIVLLLLRVEVLLLRARLRK